MAKTFHESDRRVVIGILKGSKVRHELVMQTRFSQRLSSRETLIDRMYDILNSGSDDSASTCRSGEQE